MKKYILVIGIILTLFLFFLNVSVAVDTDEISLNDVMTLVYNGISTLTIFMVNLIGINIIFTLWM